MSRQGWEVKIHQRGTSCVYMEGRSEINPIHDRRWFFIGRESRWGRDGAAGGVGERRWDESARRRFDRYVVLFFLFPCGALSILGFPVLWKWLIQLARVTFAYSAIKLYIILSYRISFLVRIHNFVVANLSVATYLQKKERTVMVYIIT